MTPVVVPTEGQVVVTVTRVVEVALVVACIRGGHMIIVRFRPGTDHGRGNSSGMAVFKRRFFNKTEVAPQLIEGID